MNFKSIAILIFVSFLLVGAVCAQKNVNDFQVDKTYKNVKNGSYYSLYLNDKQDSGVVIYKDLAGDDDDDDAYDHLIHDHGRDYLVSDDDFSITKDSDNIGTFTDYDHAQHGVSELINGDGGQYVVVFWAKDGSNVDNNQLMSQLKTFNQENNVSPIAF